VAEDSFSFCNKLAGCELGADGLAAADHPGEALENIAAVRSSGCARLTASRGCVHGGQTHADDVLRSGTYYRPDLEGVLPPGGVFVHIYGIDLVHMGDGKYAVLEDNLRVPSVSRTS
jgi:hypothetical protein